MGGLTARRYFGWSSLVLFARGIEASNWGWSRIAAELVERGLRPRDVSLRATLSFLKHREEVATSGLAKLFSGANNGPESRQR